MTWYAFTVEPNLEKRAWDGLEKIMLKPARIEAARRYRGADGRSRTVMRPLMPGYAIANVRGSIPWPLLRMIEHNGRRVIRDVLRAGGTPAPLPSDEIERLLHYVEEPDGPGFVRPGARARVVIGHHADQAAVINRVLTETRCTVMMRLFGAEREVETTVDRLREAG